MSLTFSGPNFTTKQTDAENDPVHHSVSSSCDCLFFSQLLVRDRTGQSQLHPHVTKPSPLGGLWSTTLRRCDEATTGPLSGDQLGRVRQATRRQASSRAGCAMSTCPLSRRLSPQPPGGSRTSSGSALFLYILGSPPLTTSGFGC